MKLNTITSHPEADEDGADGHEAAVAASKREDAASLKYYEDAGLLMADLTTAAREIADAGFGAFPRGSADALERAATLRRPQGRPTRG